MSAFYSNYLPLLLGGVACLQLVSCQYIQIGSSPEPIYLDPPVIKPIDKESDQKGDEEPEAISPPTAEMLESRPGFLLNPYTRTIVDVRGIPSGTLVRDPNDPDETHTFYVP